MSGALGRMNAPRQEGGFATLMRTGEIMDAQHIQAVPVTGADIKKGIRGRPHVVLAMLTFVYVLNFLDRQLLGILAKPI